MKIAKVQITRPFVRSVLGIAVPVIIGNLINITINLVDTLMIGKLGVNELAGVGAANRIFFVFIVICFGFFSGVLVHLAQYWGVCDVKNIRRLLGIDYSFAVIVSLSVMAVTYFCAPGLIGLFSAEPEVIACGGQYLRLVQFSYLFCAVSYVLNFSSRGIHRLLAPTIIGAAALLVNVFFNWCLIFGKLGFPAMGVTGAALATLIARVCECAAMFIYVYGTPGHPFAARLRELLSWDRHMLKAVLRTALPVLISESSWSIGTSLYYIAYGILGADALAVVQIAAVVSDVFQALFFGLGSACGVLIGNELGRGKKQLADDYAHFFLWLTLLLCILTTVLFILARGLIINCYDFDYQVNQLILHTLLVYALMLTPRMMTYTLFCGILRAGGDTRFTMILDIVVVWFCSVPLSVIVAAVRHWPLPAVVALSMGDEFIKVTLCLLRVRSKKWINVLIPQETDPHPTAAS